MKMKKLLAGLLSAAMVVTSVSFGGFGVNEVEAAVETTETVEQLGTVYEGTELVTNATTNSAHTATGGSQDGGAGWAFDDQDHWWHSEWQGGSVIHLPNYDRDSNVASGTQHASNRIWIQTGFTTPQNLTGLEYTSRGGTTNNQIREYEVWVKSTNEQPATTEVASVENGWKKVADDCFYPTAPTTGQNAKFDAVATNVKWVRLVAKNVYGTNSYAAAKKIRFYTTTTPTQVNLNNYKAFWESEYANGTLAKQTENDRWRFEFKDANGWKQYGGVRCGRNDGQFFEGAWRLRQGSGAIPLISKDGFRQWLHSSNLANALTWVAPKAGYYKFEQPNTAGTRSVAGDLKVYLVKNNQTTEDGTFLESGVNKDTGAPFQTKIQKMEAGDRFRFASVRGNGVNNYCDGNPTVTWQATPCTVREYATQYMEEVTLNAEKPEALQNDVTKVKEALKVLVGNTGTADDAIEQGIKDLEAAVARMNNYTGMTSVTITNDATQPLNIGESLTLNATTEPAEYSEVEWTFTPGTGVVTQDTENKNQFTANAPGTVTIKATSVYDDTKFAEVTVIVKADTKELKAKITEAKALLNAGNYTQASLDKLSTAITEAERVRDDETSTTTAIADAVNKLDEAINSLVRTYTVKAQYVDETAIGTEKTGEIGDLVTFTADEVRDGKQFVRWTCNRKQFSTSRVVTIAITGDATYVAEYEAVAEVTPEAQMINVVKTKNANGSMNAQFIGQLVLPEGAVIEETGMIFRTKNTQNFDDLVSNRDAITPATKAKKLNARRVNNDYQFMMTFSNIPATKSVSAVVFAKVNVNGVVTTVYSEITTVTNK